MWAQVSRTLGSVLTAGPGKHRVRRWGLGLEAPSVSGGRPPAAPDHIPPARSTMVPPLPSYSQRAWGAGTHHSAFAMGCSVLRGGPPIKIRSTGPKPLNMKHLPIPPFPEVPRALFPPPRGAFLTSSSCVDRSPLSSSLASSCCWVSLSAGERPGLRGYFGSPSREPSPSFCAIHIYPP